tara:strand:+ start:426 stop:1331 length:906 start_codon:yes stop_codon:yes gene_type:complete
MDTISRRFRDRVVGHIVANMMKSPTPGTPIILAIHGAPGTGKSFQLDRALQSAQTYYQTISSSDLESANANDPARFVRATYLKVADEVSANGYLSGAVVINDIDSALGNWGPLVQTTVNRQLVVGELQHISDYPSLVDNRENLRIPIIVTANDLTKLYGPLLRAGRTDIFHWQPNQSEIIDALTPSLPNLTRSEVSTFVAEVSSDSITEHLDIVLEATRASVLGQIDDLPTTLLQARRGELEMASSPTLADLRLAMRRRRYEKQQQRDYSRGSEWPPRIPTLKRLPGWLWSRTTSARRWLR